MRTAALIASTFLLVGVILAVGVLGGFAAEPCRGHWATASYYGTESGSVTANGEHFDGTSMTAASRTLPFGTRLRVTYKGQSVLVVINDRGPYSKGRSLDLSRAAAERIGLIHAGVGRVCVERLPR